MEGTNLGRLGFLDVRRHGVVRHVTANLGRHAGCWRRYVSSVHMQRKRREEREKEYCGRGGA